jgi:hypothetical protein
MSLKTRIRRLEQHTGDTGRRRGHTCRMRAQALALDVPDSQPLLLVGGQWLPCEEPELVRHGALKVYRGLDPRKV